MDIAMIVGVPKELFPGEKRVALVPDIVHQLTRKGFKVLVEKGAGVEAGFTDETYTSKGASIGKRDDVFKKADVIAQVRAYGGDNGAGRSDLKKIKAGQVIVGHTDPLGSPDKARELAKTGAISFSMELIPRITRAQSMDALSSQANVAGYKAVLIAASLLPKMFPMMMTAAGTIAPAKVFIIGAGVAGLQAIATAKRLGAIVHAYDVRPEVKEQIESLGGKFVEVELDTSEAQGTGGYAKEQSEEFLKRQREAMGKAIAEADVVITTAAVPGKRSPVLVTKSQVAAMRPGSVIVDLASERGGNCELTVHGKTITTKNGVFINGPENITSTVSFHASQMYAKNVQTLLQHLADKEGKLVLNLEDEITAGSMICQGGEIVNPRVKELIEALSAKKSKGGKKAPAKKAATKKPVAVKKTSAKKAPTKKTTKKK
ncbi:MAG: Re/Si-specific NAD(P)(+) transhydrogenase subunit alpha [bacterium]